jgi:hypothetical protein
MNPSLALTIQPDLVMKIAERFVSSGFLPRSIDNPAKAFAIITMGQEMGIGAWQAINGINVISGKPTISPQLMLALIENSGRLEDIKIDTSATQCTVVMKRVGRTAHTEMFTMDDAKRLGLTGKDNWQKQPAVMLKWRAVAACARVVFPDVIIGMYTPDEIDADSVRVNDSGEMTVIHNASSPALAPTNANPTAEPPQPEHWYTPENVAKLVGWARNQKYGDDEQALLNLLQKKWSDFPSGKEAAVAIESAHKALEAEYSEQEDTDDIPDSVNNNANAETGSFVAKHVMYVNKRITFMDFVGIGATTVPYFKGRKALAELTGEAYATANKILAWEESPNSIDIAPITVEWKKNAKGFRDLVKLTVVETPAPAPSNALAEAFPRGANAPKQQEYPIRGGGVAHLHNNQYIHVQTGAIVPANEIDIPF